MYDIYFWNESPSQLKNMHFWQIRKLKKKKIPCSVLIETMLVFNVITTANHMLLITYYISLFFCCCFFLHYYLASFRKPGPTRQKIQYQTWHIWGELWPWKRHYVMGSWRILVQSFKRKHVLSAWRSTIYDTVRRLPYLPNRQTSYDSATFITRGMMKYLPPGIVRVGPKPYLP